MAIRLGEAYGKVTLDASGVQRGVDTAIKATKSLSDSLSAMGKKMMDLGRNMTLSLTLPIVAFLGSAVKSAADAEAAIADLNAVLESTKGIAGVTADEVKKFASDMQLLTKFSDEEIIAAQSMLLTFTKIGKEVFPEAAAATLDLAQKFGMDATSAAIMLGKALNDPIAGVTALRRVGVSLTEQQEEQIKKFVEMNDLASAQRIILEELSVEVGGVAKAFGETFAGKVAIFNNRLDDLKEAIGNALIPALIELMDKITPFIQSLTESPEKVQKLTDALVFLAEVGPLLYLFGVLMKIASFFSGGGAGGQAVAWIGTTLVPAIKVIGTTITTSVIPAIASMGTAIWAAVVPLLPIIALVLAIIALVAMLYLYWDDLGVIIKQIGGIIEFYVNRQLEMTKELVKQGAKTFSEEWKKSLETWKANFKQAQEINQKVQKLAGDAMLKVIVDFVAKVNAKFTELKNWAVNTWNQITSAFTTAFSIISNFFESVKNSIIAGIQAIIDAVNELIAALESIVLPDELTPGSPTPFEIGLRGITSAMKELSRQAIPEMNRSMAMADIYAARQMAMVPAMAGAGGSQIQIVQNYASGLTERRAAQMMDGRIGAAFDEIRRLLENR